MGGCNSIDKVDGNRIGADSNEYLIAMWKALQGGWLPEQEITREHYSIYRSKYNNKNHTNDELKTIGYIGFNGSYGGRFFDGGFAGISQTKKGKLRNYPLEAFKNISSQIKFIKDVQFFACDYNDLSVPKDSVIYCDPPYFNVKGYKQNFNHDEFWQWCRDKTLEGHEVFISEYNAPDDFKCVWQKEVKSSLSANGKQGGNKNSVEKLFIYTTPDNKGEDYDR